MADITTLYRGEPWFGLTRNALQAAEEIPTLAKIAGLNVDDLSKLGGKWWTADPAKAGEYGSKIKSLKLQSGDIGKINKFGEKVTKLPSGKYRFTGLGTPIGSQNQYLLPESILKNRPSKINIGQTLKNLALQSSDEGLAFLKKNAFRTLAMLGSLPAQVGIMTLSPTTMGNAEIPQMPQGSPKQINQGEGDGGYRASRPASERRHTGHGKSGMGRDPRDRMAMGGLIDLYRYGGFI